MEKIEISNFIFFLENYTRGLGGITQALLPLNFTYRKWNSIINNLNCYSTLVRTITMM